MTVLSPTRPDRVPARAWRPGFDSRPRFEAASVFIADARATYAAALDAIHGTSGNDTIAGTSGNDDLSGQAGNDFQIIV